MPALIPGPFQDVFPTSDDAFLAWSINFAALTGADALAAGQPVSSAVLDATVALYGSNLAAASDPVTRTPVSIQTKETTKAALEQSCRLNAAYWQNLRKAGSVTNATIESFGLRIPKERAPILAPKFAPTVQVTKMQVGGTRIEVRDPNTPDRRALPYGVTNVEVQLTFGSVAEAGALQSRSGFVLVSDPSRLGQMATIRCRYATARALVGPWSDPASYIVT